MRKLAAPFLLVLSLFMMFALSFAGTAFAADAAGAAPDGSLLDLARPVLDAVLAGHYVIAAALALVLGVAVVRRYVGPHVPFLHTDAGGALLTLVASFGGAVATAVGAGAGLSWGLAWAALGVAMAAAGGYSLLNKLLAPLEAKAPAWMQPLFRLITWIFDKPDPVGAAEAAGSDAIAKTPGKGAASSIGEATELK